MTIHIAWVWVCRRPGAVKIRWNRLDRRSVMAIRILDLRYAVLSIDRKDLKIERKPSSLQRMYVVIPHLSISTGFDSTLFQRLIGGDVYLHNCL